MNDQDILQAALDRMTKDWFAERSRTQMTLGKLIDVLESMDRTTLVNLGDPHSYRGYYSDLGLTPCDATVQDLLNDCRSAMCRVFSGDTGGVYANHQNNPG